MFCEDGVVVAQLVGVWRLQDRKALDFRRIIDACLSWRKGGECGCLLIIETSDGFKRQEGKRRET